MSLLSVFRLPKVVPALFVCGLVFSGSSSAAISLEQQRNLYDQAQDWLDEDDVAAYQKVRAKLKNYPLAPYLDYRAMLVNIGKKSPRQVREFIQNYQDYPFSARISAPYLTALAKEKKWQEFLAFQHHEPIGESFQCDYYYAKWVTGDQKSAFRGARALWLKGDSIADECDPLFRAWAQSGGRTDELIYQRMLLAFDARNPNLISYLAQKLQDQDMMQWGMNMLELYSHPQRIVYFAKRFPRTSQLGDLIELSIKKVARTDAKKARQLLNSVKDLPHWREKQTHNLARYIALQLLHDDDQTLVQWRDSVVAASKDPLLVQIRTRLAIRHADWQGVKAWISLLPKHEQESLRWQYWLGRSDMELGLKAQGTKRLSKVIGQRNFYSVAAANALKQSIHYPNHEVNYRAGVVAPYTKALDRIDELIKRDKIAAAKREWGWLLDRVNHTEKEMLAVYAANQHWYHLTVTASISASLWDNIELRFPLAHQWWFNFWGNKHNVDPITLMSVARQESALDADAHSSVGARGIMQIMPSTARYTAKKYQLDYSGADELYDVGKNIEIGSHYFKSLLKRYDKNRIFALAAYNAGPARVDRWRSETQGKLGPYAFIESIPYKETRGYVQNILMFEVYYRDLTGTQGRFLTSMETQARY